MNRKFSSDQTSIHAALAPETLDKVLGHPIFQASSQISRMLAYLVEETLKGRGEYLKEYSIGVDVFNRSKDFNPRADSIVRVEAARLRSKLEEYYAGDGRHDPVRFAIPKGSYVAEFLPPRRTEETADAATRKKLSLAILPFHRIGTTPTQNEQLEGFVFALTTDLSRQPGLSVLAGMTTLAYQSAGKLADSVAEELGVSHLLTGCALRMNEVLRITLELVDGNTGRIVWSERYHTDEHNLLAVQDKISANITPTLAAKLGLRGPARNVSLQVINSDRRGNDRRANERRTIPREHEASNG